MREALVAYVKRVKDLADHVKGNEQATKQSLIGPLFTLLGYDLTDPRECIPEYRADFGKERSVKPVDWAFLQHSRPCFFVEAKDAAKKLGGYDEQLADYFAKVPEAKLGILTNGIHWRFFTDIVNDNIMDKEPFVKWDVLVDEQPPYDFLTLLQKSEYKPELIRAFAQRKHAQNLLVNELARLLEPAPEFTRLAIANIETRNLTAAVVESWKAVVANAVIEWAKQRTLSTVLNQPPRSESSSTAGEPTPPVKVDPSADELASFATVQRLLSLEKPVGYEKTASYFKIHLPGQRFWAVCRLYLNKKRPVLRVPLVSERVAPLVLGLPVTSLPQGWTSLQMGTLADLDRLGEVLRAAWDHQWSMRGKGADTGDSGTEENGADEPPSIPFRAAE